jgi:hypothetical protein
MTPEAARQIRRSAWLIAFLVIVGNVANIALGGDVRALPAICSVAVLIYCGVVIYWLRNGPP